MTWWLKTCFFILQRTSSRPKLLKTSVSCHAVVSNESSEARRAYRCQSYKTLLVLFYNHFSKLRRLTVITIRFGYKTKSKFVFVIVIVIVSYKNIVRIDEQSRTGSYLKRSSYKLTLYLYGFSNCSFVSL